MTTTFCSTSSSVHSSSFFTYEDFPQTFRRTPSDHLSPPPPSPTESKLECAGRSVGLFVDDCDFGMASCTESLGFESSNIMVSDSSCDCCSSNRMMSEDYSNYRERKERGSPLPEKDFPPPLSSLSGNGRRNFTLMPVRNNGRLEIVRVPINRPEILYSSRQNGRLILHLVRSSADDEYDYYEEEEEEEEKGVEAADEKEESETTVVTAMDEEREWKIPAVRRCYQRELYAWAQQQNRCVTTM